MRNDNYTTTSWNTIIYLAYHDVPIKRTVHKIVNFMKRDMSIEELKEWCRRILNEH